MPGKIVLMFIKLTLFLLIVAQGALAQSFKDLHKTSSHVSGPNCWNGALVASGTLEHKRFVYPSEWLLLIKRHCKEVEKPQVNSLGRIFDLRDGEVHGFVHLDQKTIFAKHGEDRAHGYEIMSYEKMMNQYGKRRECRINGSTKKECDHVTVYYQCETAAKVHPLLRELSLELERYVFSKSTKYYYKVRCTDTNFINRTAILKRMKSILLQYENVDVKNKDLEFDREFKKSVIHQLYNMQVSQRNFKCKDRTQRDLTIKEVQELTKRAL
jgi:hypothetical protein